MQIYGAQSLLLAIRARLFADVTWRHAAVQDVRILIHPGAETSYTSDLTLPVVPRKDHGIACKLARRKRSKFLTRPPAKRAQDDLQM